MQYLKTSLMDQAKQQHREWDSAHNHTIMLGRYYVRIWQIRRYSQCSIRENTYSSSNLARRFYEHRQVCKCGEHLDSTWIHIRPRSRSRSKFNNEKIFAATERTVVAIYARSLTIERQPDCFQRMACHQSSNS